MTNQVTDTWTVLDKTALITGGGSGIGLELTRQLLERGCNVFIADLTLRPEAKELIDSTAGKKPHAQFLKTDVSLWLELEASVKACLEHFGQLDLVVPAAGIFEPDWSAFWYPPGTSESADAVDSNSYKTLDINLTHPIRLTQLALAHFIPAKNSGRVVLISSIAAQGVSPKLPLYSASKAAISSFIRSLARLDPDFGIRINGVAPGIVRTPMWTDPKHVEKMTLVDQTKDIWIEPKDIAKAIIHLSEAPDMPGGTVLEIGAGSTRKVERLNDPGPAKEGPGLNASGGVSAWGELKSRIASGWPFSQ